MRELREYCTPGILSLETLSVLQFCTTDEPLLPNLKTLYFWGVNGPDVPFIPLFLSPRITYILLNFYGSDPPIAMVASMVTTFPKLYPELQVIRLNCLPRDPMITAAVSRMVLAANRNTLQQFDVDSPLTEEASGVVYTLPNLCQLSVDIERVTSLPSASLPNLTELTIKCENEGKWPRLFHGATFGKLESITFYPESEGIGDFLGAFERAALSSSVEKTLSLFRLSTSRSWDPNYSSLLPFVQLSELYVGFSCDDGCSSKVDDDIVISLSRAMPKLTVLQLGNDPCREFNTGVTTKGLVALALHCPALRCLRIHFQVASLSAPPVSPGVGRNTDPTSSWTNSGLLELVVGEIVVPEESVLMVALTLLRIFPLIESIYFIDEGWGKVEDAIQLSKRILDCSSKHHPFTIPRRNFDDTSVEVTLETSS